MKSFLDLINSVIRKETGTFDVLVLKGFNNNILKDPWHRTGLYSKVPNNAADIAILKGTVEYGGFQTGNRLRCGRRHEHSAGRLATGFRMSAV